MGEPWSVLGEDYRKRLVRLQDELLRVVAMRCKHGVATRVMCVECQVPE